MTTPISPSGYNNTMNLINSSLVNNLSSGTSDNSSFNFSSAMAYNDIVAISGQNDSYINTGLSLLQQNFSLANQSTSLATPQVQSTQDNFNQMLANNLFSNNSTSYNNNISNLWQSLGSIINLQI